MSERLTKWEVEGCASVNGCSPIDKNIANAINRLCDLEDKIEQGKILELPCKVGDTIWEVWAGGSEVTEIQRGVMTRCHCVPCVGSNDNNYKDLDEVLNDTPTADVVEVRHGEWRKVNDKYPRYVCTVCNHLFNNKNYNYCPCCGAKMDRERREG